MWTLTLFIALASCVLADRFQDRLGHLGPKAPPLVQQQAAEGVLHRLLGEDSSIFQLIVDPALRVDGKDSFEIKSRGNYVDIVASTGVAACWGAHYYLKEFCNCHVSWDGDRISIPKQLPEVDIQVRAQDRFRYYQNVCTTSYSFVWWDWDRWEREIDWMALNGYNLVLALNGQESIWYEVYKNLGMNDTEISEHFAGPAFYAWGRMGNIRGWGGPASIEYYLSQEILQHKILERMRSLGIIPVLPGFSGIVPRALTRRNSFNYTVLPAWNRFADKYTSPYLVSPDDDFFMKIAMQFSSLLLDKYGTDHVYSSDTFNEMTPTSGDLSYLNALGKKLYKGMAANDIKAVWMLQGWLFKSGSSFWSNDRCEAFLTSVPVGKILVLDLQAELNPQYARLDSFFGQPFIWCMLHNFGGTLGLQGAVKRVNQGVFDARNFANSSMVGIGLTPEGINTNYVVYDLMNEMAWRNKPADLKEWFQNYALRRYGLENENVTDAWELLRTSVYNYQGSTSLHGQYILVKHPTPSLKQQIWYKPQDVWRAWEHLVTAADEAKNPPSTLLYDVVDLTRQSLQLLIDNFYKKSIRAFRRKRGEELNYNVLMFSKTLEDLENILSSHSSFLLGPWLESAKASATSPKEARLFEVNARNQITLWGPEGEIRDYATKQWSGVVKDYYSPRWWIFFEALINEVRGGPKYNRTETDNRIMEEVELPFSYNRDKYPTEPRGNVILIAKEILKRWKPHIGQV